MKKIYQLFIVLVLTSLLLGACGGEAAQAPAEPVEEESEAPADSGEGEPAEPAEVEPVKVGIVEPMSGDGAYYGALLLTGFEFAVDEINSQGGIKSLGGAPLELVVGDHQGNPEVGISEVERLVQEEGVAVLAGGEFSGVAIAMSTATERLQVPIVIDICGADAITERGLKYVFRTNIKGSWYGDSFVSMLDYINDEMGVEMAKIAGVYKDTEAGASFIGGALAKAEEAGYEIVFNEAYPPDIKDMTTLVARIKATNPDVILTNDTTAAGSIQFTKALADVDVDPKLIVTMSGGYEFPDWSDGVGELKDGWLHIVQWRDGLPGVEELKAEYAAFTDDELTSRGLIARQVIYIIAEALEIAGSRDPVAIRDALAEVRIEPGPHLVMPWPFVDYDDTGQNLGAQNIGVQWVGDDDLVVFPANQAIQDILVPHDYWEQ